MKIAAVAVAAGAMTTGAALAGALETEMEEAVIVEEATAGSSASGVLIVLALGTIIAAVAAD